MRELDGRSLDGVFRVCAAGGLKVCPGSVLEGIGVIQLIVRNELIGWVEWIEWI